MEIGIFIIKFDDFRRFISFGVSNRNLRLDFLLPISAYRIAIYIRPRVDLGVLLLGGGSGGGGGGLIKERKGERQRERERARGREERRGKREERRKRREEERRERIKER